MSDIVNPRIESYYLHPKKFAWRSDKELFSSDERIALPEEENIASVIKERFKMVISSNYTIQNEIEQPTLIRNNTSQEAPLDFSVKTVISSPNGHQTFSENPQPESAVIKDRSVPSNHAEMYAKSSNALHSPTLIHKGKILSSPSPIYNGSSKMVCPKQKNSHNSSPKTHGLSQTHPDNGYTDHPPLSDAPLVQNDSLQQTRLGNANCLNPESPLMNCDEASFASNGMVSPKNSPKLSGESSPDDRHYKGSILHDALAKSASERPQAHRPISHAQGMNPTTTCTNPGQRSETPPFISTNSATPMTPDSGSVQTNSNNLIPGPNPIMPATFGFFNGLGFPPTAMAGINPYVNGNILSPSLDNRISQTQNSGDKKAGKPIRPFKAITNELLYGMPAMGLPTMNPFIPNGGYFRDYVQGATKETHDVPKSSPLSKREFNEVSTNSAINQSPPCSSNTDPKIDVAGSGDSNCSFADGSNSAVENGDSTGNHRKRTRTMPDDLKDEAYWERRRKNNQAAKRSRDARRQKEDMVAQQAWLFREQNIQLRFQLTGLEEQHQRLQLQWRAVTEQCRNLELQLRLANEKLSRSRCGKCGSRTDSDGKSYIESNKND